MTNEEVRHRAIQDSLRQALNKSGIFSYAVQYDNGHRQSITCKASLVTEGKIIPDAGQTIREFFQIHGRVPYIHGQHDTLQRERVIDQVRAQANLAGAFHAVHKLVIGNVTPQGVPINERYVLFTAVPVFIQR